MKNKHCFKNIAHFIKLEREKVGLSQVQMAEKAGWNTGQFVSNIERGKCSVPLKSIKKVSKILEVTPMSLKQVLKMDFKETLNNFAND